MKVRIRRSKRKCYFRRNHIKHLKPQQVELLRKFISPTGKILPGSVTKVSSGPQRKLARAIKTARKLGLLPFSL